jgi:5-methylcytosine-specific restriction endonuclease McrA
MSKHHQSAEYYRNSRVVRRILGAKIRAGNFVPCVECGRAVQAGQLWDVGHIIDAAKGGTNALSNLGAAHRGHNRAAGGRAGATVRNRASRRARRLPSW